MTSAIFIGIPASGKSTFYKEKFFSTHIRISLDMLKTRHREQLLVAACLGAKQPYVVDNTNATAAEREVFIQTAKESGFRVVGYYFSTKIQDALERNRLREGKASIPDQAVRAIAGRLKLPSLAEGFDEIWSVQIDGNGKFILDLQNN
jgi:predicted kinase